MADAAVVAQLVDQLLTDFSQPQPLFVLSLSLLRSTLDRSHSLSHSATALLELHSSPEPLAVIVLSSAINKLLASLFHPSSPSSSPSSQPQQLASFFHQHLFLPLSASSSTATGDDERKAALADALIDGCWQLDQEVEVLVPLLVKKQQQNGGGEAMQVDEVANEQEVVKQSLTIIAQGREKLGKVVKQLIVRPSLSLPHCRRRD